MECLKIMVAGAWRKESWEGAVAWCRMMDQELRQIKGRERVIVSSATMMMTKALAVLKALERAKSKNWQCVEILTDCLLLLKGLIILDGVDVFVKPVNFVGYYVPF